MTNFIHKNSTEKKAKPFLKWAGGKSQLLSTFQGFFPTELQNWSIKNYYEPFLGGGAVFFSLAQHSKIKTAYLYDINPELILVYKVVQNKVQKLIENLADLKSEYQKQVHFAGDKFYYQIRQQFNNERVGFDYQNYSDKWIKRAAQLIFLNKTCYNGLFRFNKKGEFNTPAGKYKNPAILDEQNLLLTSELLQIAIIKNAAFEKVESDIKQNSFVYFDPPYRPISSTSQFTSYSKNVFADEQQKLLNQLFKRLNKKGVLEMLSNSDPKNTNPQDNFFDDLYTDFFIYRVPAKRMINSKAKKRNAVNELIITNYLPK